jgi:hypothetical protein
MQHIASRQIPSARRVHSSFHWCAEKRPSPDYLRPLGAVGTLSSALRPVVDFRQYSLISIDSMEVSRRRLLISG